DARKRLEEASASVEGLVEQARQEVDSSPATSAANAAPGSTAPATSAASATTPATEAAAIQTATADAAPVTAEDTGTRKCHKKQPSKNPRSWRTRWSPPPAR